MGSENLVASLKIILFYRFFYSFNNTDSENNIMIRFSLMINMNKFVQFVPNITPSGVKWFCYSVVDGFFTIGIFTSILFFFPFLGLPFNMNLFLEKVLLYNLD